MSEASLSLEYTDPPGQPDRRIVELLVNIVGQAIDRDEVEPEICNGDEALQGTDRQ